MQSWQVRGQAFGNWIDSPKVAPPPLAVSLAISVVLLGVAPRVALAAVHASILVDAQSGAILRSSNADLQAHPASLTKLMTLYITFARLKSGRLHLDQRLRVSRHAAAQQPTKLWLPPGSSIKVRAAILGMTTRSANDAAVVLAEAIGGSEIRFTHLMNAQARRLGMANTAFYNASGLPDIRQWTTARDMSKLALALIDRFPEYYHFFGARSFRFSGHIIYGHDHVLDEFSGADGLKTGYIRASGFNLVTSAIRDHRRLVGVVLGGNTARARDLQMIALLKRGFAAPPPSTELVARARPERERPERKPTTAQLVSAAAEVPDPDESSDWTIQIGAGFHSEHGARRILKSARLTFSLLRRNHELIVKLRRSVYRARFSHLNHATALRACYALEKKSYTCRILRHAPTQTNDIASAAAPHDAQSD